MGDVPVHAGCNCCAGSPGASAGDGLVDGPPDRRGQRDQDDLGALADPPHGSADGEAEQAALKILYLVTRGLGLKGTGQARRTMR